MEKKMGKITLTRAGKNEECEMVKDDKLYKNITK